MSRRRRDREKLEPGNDPVWLSSRLGIVTLLVAIGTPVLLYILSNLNVDAASLVCLAALITLFTLLIAIGFTESMRRIIDKDDPRKDKPVESTLLPPPPDDSIDPEATYTLTSDGELMEVVDDDKPPPALSFKVSDEDE